MLGAGGVGSERGPSRTINGSFISSLRNGAQADSGLHPNGRG